MLFLFVISFSRVGILNSRDLSTIFRNFAEISHINSVSAEASVSGGSEGREMARQMNESVGKLGTRTTRLIRAYGVTDDIWQQGLAHWGDLASGCGVDAKRKEEDDDDSC